jgi:sulfoxide reductase heme-binding subunit YedZ
MNVDHLEWVLARSAGMVSVILLTLAVALGIALSLKLSSPAWPRLLTNEAHRLLTTLALWTVGLHVLMLVVDPVAGLSVTDMLVPFAAGYHPAATALGILGLYLVLTVWVTTRLRDRIGYRRWRKLHMLAFAAYGAVMLHGILAGTDSGELWTTGLYVASGVLVAGLLVARIATARRRPSSPPPPPAPSRPGHPGGLPPLAPSPGHAGLPPLPGRASSQAMRHT